MLTVKSKDCCKIKTIGVMRISKLKNMLGLRFGQLTVIERDTNRVFPCGQQHVYWKCLCDCGNVVSVSTSQLSTGRTTKCVKCGKVATGKALTKDLTGQKYGHLLVIERDDDQIQPSGKRVVRWKCVCDCGNVCSVSSSNLRTNHTIQCATCAAISRAKNHTIDLVGQRFGKLVVVEKASSRTSPCGQSHTFWKCLCDCGNETIVSTSNLKNKSGTRSCGCVISYGEEKVAQVLHKLNLCFKKQFCIDDLKLVEYLRFDFAVTHHDAIVCLIEYQGIQHYKNKGEFGKQQRETTDQMKRDYCAAHNIPLYEIAYNENIEQRLDEILEDLKQTHNIDLATIYDNTVPSQSEAA